MSRFKLKLESSVHRTHILAAIVFIQFLLLIIFSPLGTFLSENYNIAISFISINGDSKNSDGGNHTFCGYFIRHPWDGGLGSQMFVYASFYGMISRINKNAKKLSFIRVYDKPSSLDSYFHNLTISRRLISDDWIGNMDWIKLKEKSCCSYTDHNLESLPCDGKNHNVTGFRVSYKYLAHVEFAIRDEFKFNKDIKGKSQNLIKYSLVDRNLDPNRCTTIGAHFRRGDFLSQRSQKYGHWPAQLDYVKKAVHFYESWYYNITSNYSYPVIKNPRNSNDCLVFFLFGNDYAWNLNITTQLELLRANHTHVIVINFKNSSPGVDMCALSMCDHNIISTGTFGWWSAFLGQGMVTYQNEYAKIGSDHYHDFDDKAYFLPEWIAL